jgi:hypothetical protein
LVLSGAGCDGFESREEGRLGALLWQYELAHPEVVDKTQPALDGEAVYVAGGRELLAFTLADGTVRWKVPLPGAPSSQNLPFDDRALYVVVAGAMRAYDKAQGALLWETPIDDRISPFEVIAQTPGYLFLGSRGYVARFRKHDGAVDLKYRLAERKPEGIEQRTRFGHDEPDIRMRAEDRLRLRERLVPVVVARADGRHREPWVPVSESCADVFDPLVLIGRAERAGDDRE